MKKKLFFAVVAIGLLASCAENEYVGEVSPNSGTNDNNAIVFNSSAFALTRADHVGADAADLLGKKFIVGGYKGGSAENGVAATGDVVSTVFDNYLVEWTANTAATTESNTSDWEYVGKNIPATSGLYISDEQDSNYPATQTIKYWDFSASQYDFIAYSVGKGNTLVAKTTSDIATGTPESNQVWVTPIAPSTAKTAAYQLRGLKADLLECYIADLKTVLSDKYKEEVQLDFRRLASKVRIALYETIPGYSVKDVKFYVADDTPIKEGETGYEAPTTTATLFTSGSGNVFNSNGTYTISFPTIGTANNTANNGKDDYNQAHVTFTADGTSGSGTTETFGTLDYTTAQRNETAGSYYLGRTSNAASYAKTSGTDYQYVLPNEDGAVLELRVDYTLVSIDGSGEEINIYGAKAFVPATYAKWNSNFAYTYIFKISDNTNGWTSNTGGAGKEGLYPITFDAVITEAENYNKQTTITTVATPSITTYQKGHDITKDEYSVLDTDPEIYVQVIVDGALKDDLGSKGQLYTLDKAATEAEVMDALNIQSASDENTITGRNSLVLTKATSSVSNTTDFKTIPGVDGNDIDVAAGTAAKFTPVAPTEPATVNYYAYVYDTGTDNDNTVYNTAVVFDTTPQDWANIYQNYYTDEACTTPAPATFPTLDQTTPSVTYYQKYTNQNKVYGVKVIKVVAAPSNNQGNGGARTK